MKVEILSRKLISPSSPTPEHLQTLKISRLDQLVGPFYVPRVFYYLPNGEEEGLIKTREKSEQLQKSLAETLTLFYPLAGRYIREKRSIDCNDKGAEYLEAEVSGSLSQLLGQGGGKLRSEWLNNLVPDPEESDNTPLVFVQFNTFTCGGVAIGVCASHRAADGSSVFNFIDSWAKVSRMGHSNLQFSPNFNLGSFFPHEDLLPEPPRKLESGHVELTFKRLVFTATSISNLKEIAASSTTNTDQPPLIKHQPTRVEVVFAFIWMSFIRTFQARHGRLMPSLLTIPVNMRKKTKLQVSESSCGNFVGRAIAMFLPGDGHQGKLQLPDMVGKVQDAIRSSVSNLAKASTPEDIVSLVYGAFGEMVKRMNNPEFDCCFSTSWCRFPAYEMDFGWGKPSWVTSVMKPRMRNNIFLMDTKDGDGIEAWVILGKSDMHVFEQDSEVIPFLDQDH